MHVKARGGGKKVRRHGRPQKRPKNVSPSSPSPFSRAARRDGYRALFFLSFFFFCFSRSRPSGGTSLSEYTAITLRWSRSMAFCFFLSSFAIPHLSTHTPLSSLAVHRHGSAIHVHGLRVKVGIPGRGQKRAKISGSTAEAFCLRLACWRDECVYPKWVGEVGPLSLSRLL